MHICVISPAAITDRANWGGIHTHTEMLLRILVKEGIKATLITSDYSDKAHKEAVDGIEVLLMPGVKKGVFDRNWVSNVSETFKKVNKEDPVDCIFSESYSAFGLEKKIKFKNLPVFSFVHNFHLMHFYNNWTEVENFRSLSSYFLRTVPRLFFRMFRYEVPFYHRSRWIISGSSLNAKVLQNIYRIPQKRVRVVHNWVNTDRFAPDDFLRKEYRRKFSISDDTLVFLLVGSLWRPKGFHIAVEAFKKFAEEVSNTLLLIAGTGGYEEKLRVIINKDKNLMEKVRFIGFCKNSELPSLYNGSDIFLMPSLFSEVLPYALIEAMSCGLPVIATRIGGNSELAGEAGILVPPGDIESLAREMIILAKDTEKRKYFSQSARKRVLEFFSEGVAAKKILKLIKETL